ncbi:MAG: DUF5052 family protein [Bacteroidaceae bacterium]|nr:DUF5052 family protein [Bacteroidaceae bacterium]
MIKRILFFAAILFAVLSLSGCESCKRDMRSLKSDMSGGLQRTVTLYDYNGNVLRQWKGKFDVQDDNGTNSVYFDLNGKRVIVSGGIIVNEED